MNLDLAQQKIRTTESEMKLFELFQKYNCDKGYKHRYDYVYEKIFQPVKDQELNILEIGVFKGASTQAFLEYFPKAKFYALDLFVRVKPEEIKALNSERVQWLKGDSMNPAIRSQVAKAFPDVKFDFIIDDGMHTPKANKVTFQNLSPLLKEGGSYIIEDVWPLEQMNPEQLKHPWLRLHSDRYGQLDNNDFLMALDTSRMDITRYDQRKKTGEPDSYIIELK